MIGKIRTRLGVWSDPMFLWISLISFPHEFAACSKPLNRDNHCKRLIKERNNITWVRVEPRPFDQGRR